MIIDEARWKVIVEGVEASNKKLEKFANTWKNATTSIKGNAAGTAGLTQSYGKLSGQLDGLVKHNQALVANMKQLNTGTKAVGASLDEGAKHAGGFTSGILNAVKSSDGLIGRMKQLVMGGMLMSIGWQAINGILQGTIKAINDLVMGGVELEANMAALSVVSDRTGRSFASVMGTINQNVDAFMTRGQAMQGTLRLLSTELSTDQINNFIGAVKEGSAAMGYQAGEQLPLIARGYKQLTANILDNIGVTVYLQRIRRRAARELDVTVDSLSEAQIHTALYNEIIEQTAKYTGTYASMMDTAKGSMARIGTEWVRLTETVSSTEGIKNASNAIADLIAGLTAWAAAGETLQKYDLSYTIGGIEPVSPVRIMKTTEAFAALAPYFEEFNKNVEEATALGIDMTREQEAMDESARNLFTTYDVAAEDVEGLMDKLHGLMSVETELDSIRKTSADTMDELSKKMEEHLQMLIEARPLMSEYTALYDDLTEAQKENQLSMTEVERQIKSNDERLNELRYGIYETDEGYQKLNTSLSEYRQQLKEVTAELRDATAAQREQKSVVSDIERQLEKKNKVLYPEQLATEQRYTQVVKDLTAAKREQERAQERLLKRVEPKIYKQYQEEAARADEKVLKLEEEQICLKDLLQDEIAELADKLAIEKAKYEDLTTAVDAHKKSQQTLQGTIDETMRKTSDLTESNVLLRAELKRLVGRKEDIEEMLAGVSEGIDMIRENEILAESQTDALISKLNALAKIPPIEKEVTIKMEELRTVVKRYKSSGSSSSFYGGSGITYDEYGQGVSTQYGYATGTRNVPRTGLAMIHAGEQILNNFQQKTETSYDQSMVFESGAIIIQAGNRNAMELFNEIDRIAKLKLARRMGR